MSNHKKRLTTGAKPPALAGPEVAHFSMSEVARFSMSLDKRYALGPWVVAEEVAGHADLAAAAGAEHRLIKPGPVFDLLGAGGL